MLTGQCPIGFCANVNDSFLPPTANQSCLNDFVCVHSRFGTLCGKCKAGLQHHFHSPQLECKSSKYCFLGWPLYLISEILPVTIIFVVILFFNVPFTSGILNGFIFYSQVVEMLPTNTYYHNQLDIFSEVLNRVHYLIYMTFNLKPLEMKELSFCIYSSQSALDIIALNYVTLIYSFVLLLFLFLIISKNKFCCLRICKRFIQFFNFEQGIKVHGLIAFLILCYANCARTSLLLLISENLYAKEKKFIRSVVYYNGELEWMMGKHLGYAIPAIIVLILVCGIPPLLLLIYPSHFRLLSALKIDQLPLTRVIMKPLDKLKPIFDSFQGCFKDHCRFFAGLYFIYRLLIIMIVMLFNIQDASFLLELLFILMIFLHALFQPYKKSTHNTIDMLIFINLSLINTITLYNINNMDLDPSVTILVITGVIRNMFILLPAIIVMIYVLKKKCSCHGLREVLPHSTTAASEEVEFFEFEAKEYRSETLYSEYERVE